MTTFTDGETIDSDFLTLCQDVHGYIELSHLEASPSRGAPYLTFEEAEAFSSMTHDPDLSEQQRRQAECAAQPGWIECSQTPNGTRRTRPALRLTTVDRRNDYDALLDKRQYSPNGRISGFPDWDREEIERENTMPEPWFHESAHDDIDPDTTSLADLEPYDAMLALTSAID